MPRDTSYVVSSSLGFAQTFEFTFDNNSHRVVWNVAAACRLAIGKPRAQISLSEIHYAFLANPAGADVTPAKLARANMDIPILVVPAPSVTEPTSKVIIDGWHRMAKAVLTDTPWLWVVTFTRDEEIALRLQDIILCQ